MKKLSLNALVFMREIVHSGALFVSEPIADNVFRIAAGGDDVFTIAAGGAMSSRLPLAAIMSLRLPPAVRISASAGLPPGKYPSSDTKSEKHRNPDCRDSHSNEDQSRMQGLFSMP